MTTQNTTDSKQDEALEPCPHTSVYWKQGGMGGKYRCCACELAFVLVPELCSRTSVPAVGEDAAEVIRQFLRDHALSPRAPLLVDGEAVCVCVICQSAREVMRPVFAKERAELDRVLAEAEVEDPVGVRFTELQLNAAASSSSPAEPPELQSLRDENKRLRDHVADLNHDLEAAIKECNEQHG